MDGQGHREHAWLTEDDDGGLDAKRTAEFVLGVVEEGIRETLNPSDTEVLGDKELETRIKANTQVEGLGRIQALGDKADRAMIFQIGQIVSDGIYHYAEAEPENIHEMLTAALDGIEAGSSTWYDLTFIAEQLLPFMVAQEIPNAAVLWAKGYKKKTRVAVPLLRHLFKIHSNVKKLDKEVRKVIDWIVDPAITKQILQEKAQKERGIEEIEKAYGVETILPHGRTRIVIECDKVQLDAIKRKLSGLVDIQMDEKEAVEL
jgi:hypothetical protein